MSGSRSIVPAALLTGLALLALVPELLAQEAPGRRGRGARVGQAAREAAAEQPAQASLPESWSDALAWRSIGPANMSGRITALAVVESDPSTWWAATASGGLLKTANNGVSFEHQFDREATVSIGDVQVSQSDPNIVWVGTGESNPRNSVSWGNGVYKSVDGGASWTHMGLDESYQIGRMAIHPHDPDIVYVGALGRLWGDSEERGLYKTVDGGETWERILYVDDKTGVVDVNLMPGDPDTLLVATYERRRDGFDTNDPIKKWGPGSGLWKSTDGGASFRRMTQGLPTVEIGRIDVDFFRADPGVVFALVESSKIGLEPENAAYFGVSGEDADVGARVTEVAEGSPAAAAGLKPGDVVVEVGGEIVQSFDDLVARVRRHLAGETVGFRLSRERKTVAGEVTFAHYPEAQEDSGQEPPAEVAAVAKEANEAKAVEATAVKGEAGDEAGGDETGEEAGAESADVAAAPKGSARPDAAKDAGRATADDAEAGEGENEEPAPRSTFRTRLGGQVANVQDQQGPDGHEYGGLYKSLDGGETWKRINSVNPRPMYFSQVRVDPSDSNHVYVLGVPLYRSKDGGNTFTNDGGGGGVHVDHHALWIDPQDGEHAILGNDGGIYVTWDRLETWDHYNHVAIGQFYHVAVGPRRDYRAYGGLQDNGTWGAPARARDGGTRNEDWISIGGGDGFIVRVDPDDPDLVYYESQNGSLGRRNLRTGERGFLRPQAPRGTRYRFNWKTPFILSAHNAGIYYTAGNHVFRSWLRGDDLQAISPEITRTDRGSATAVAESPLDAGVLYVGTDDGALWTTKNGGHEWTSLFPYEREAEEADPRPSTAIAVAASARRPGADSGSKGGTNGHAQEGSDKPGDPLTGRWTVSGGQGGVGAGGGPGGAQGARRGGRRAGGGGGGAPGGGGAAAAMMLDLKLDAEGALSGTLTSPRGDSALSRGSFDPETGGLQATFGDATFATTLTATLAEGKLTGNLDFGGRFQREFEAERGEAVARRDDGFDWKPIAELVPQPMWVTSIETSGFEAARVYLALDGHRHDDDRPWIFVSEDHGSTWRSLRGNLPDSAGSSRVLREDIVNGDVLYLGTEFGAWTSIDRGASWTKLGGNLPTVAVHEFAQHATAGEIVAGTHGRSLWVLDVTPLRQLSVDAIAAEAQLYRPNSAIYWRSEPRRGGTLRRYEGEVPATGASVYYSLGEGARGASLRVLSPSGDTLAELETATEPGLHVATWNLRPDSPDASGAQGGRGARRGGGGRFRRGAPRVEPGTYTVELRAGGRTSTQPLRVERDPEHPDEVLWGEEYERRLDVDERFGGTPIDDKIRAPRVKVL